MQEKQRSLREEAQDDSCGADLELLVQMEAGKPGALEGPRGSGEATAQLAVSDTWCHPLPAVRRLLRS